MNIVNENLKGFEKFTGRDYAFDLSHGLLGSLPPG